ncbi:unnamed protein product, partial [Amoebophrya sp. A25]
QATALFRRLKTQTEQANADLINATAPEHLKRVLQTTKTRNVIAMRKLIALTGHPDTSLPDDILHGFQTIGEYKSTGLWKADVNAAEAKDLKE